MFEEERIVKVYRVTIKKIIERLTGLQEIDVAEFKDEVLDQFDGYDYKDVEEIVGFENWPQISNDGEYQLNVKVNHEDAYEFTIHIKTKDKKVSVINVL